MQDAEPQQVFVRNDKGTRWGPLAPQTLELLLDGGLIVGKIQISTDGEHFAWPGRFEDLRDFVPPELWGDGFVPPPGYVPPSHAPAAAEFDPPPGQPTAPIAAAPGTVPAAGPGAVRTAGPRAPLMAGPGARAVAAAPRTGPGAQQMASQPRAPQQVPQVPRVGPPQISPAGPPVMRPAAGAPQAAASRAPIAPPGASPRAPVAPPPPAPAGAPPAAAAPARPPTPAPAPAFAEEVTALPAEGDLAKVSPVRLYYLAASGQQTGRLSIQLPDRLVEVHFRKGNPEHVSSTHGEDAVAGFLLREGLVRPEQLAAAEGNLERFGGDVLAAFFGTGALNPATAFTHLAQRAQGLLLRALVAQSGTFRWSAEELASHKAMPLGNRWGVLMELVRKIPPAELRRRMQGAADHPVMKSGGQVATADLRLTPQETRALGFIDGVRSLNLLARDLPQDADAFFRLAWVLGEMDVVSFAAARLPPPEREPPPPPPSDAAKPPPAGPPKIAAAAGAPPASPPKPAAAAAPPRPAPPVMTPQAAKPAAKKPAPAPAPPAAPVDYGEEILKLQAQVAKLRDQNLFEVLGLTDKADSGQVKLAYFKLARLYHPDTIPQDAPADLGKLRADVFAKVGEAYRTLGEDASRANYIADLAAGGVGDVDVAAILHAEELFQKSCILVKAKKFPEAVDMLTEAITLNADEGEFYAWRAAARFFAQKDRKVGELEANRDFDLALKKNPRCAAAFFFQGQIAKLLGDPKKATALFKKTLDLQPDHLDAQRELRYLTKK